MTDMAIGALQEDLSSLPPMLALLEGCFFVCLQLLEFAFPVWLLARACPRRGGTARRMGVAAGLLALMWAVSIASAKTTISSPGSGVARYAINLAGYSALLVALAAAAHALRDIGWWNALFYATAGYTIQNLGSGAGELARLVIEQATGARLGLMEATALSAIAIALACALCYQAFIRKADTARALHHESSGMLGMAAFVILLVIANDVVIRGLGNLPDVPWHFLVALRCTHLAICVFVLYAEYEALFKARLQGEVEATSRLADERARQYELSRQNVMAIDARLHDVRHQVLRELSDADSTLPRETLAEIAREITVYDAIVHTGNTALDTAISEKQLLCQQEGITLTCIADGKSLGFLTATETYALISDLLDGAIATTRGLASAARRTISLNVHAVGTLTSVHLAYPAAAGVDRLGEGGMFATARAIAESHGGALAASSTGAARSVDAVIPSRGRMARPGA